MSTELGGVSGVSGESTISATRYFGGTVNGVCVQLTLNSGKYIGLTESQWHELVNMVGEGFNESNTHQAIVDAHNELVDRVAAQKEILDALCIIHENEIRTLIGG